MQPTYTPPSYGKGSFNCPTCQAFAHQKWYEAIYEYGTGLVLTPNIGLPPDPFSEMNGRSIDNVLAMSTCYQCNAPSVWVEGKLVYPLNSIAPLPNQDMPEDVLKLYNEAREVSAISPRASTALLRLAVEKLLPQVGATQGKIDKMIGELVAQGLPQEVQRALDSLRVIGNEAVHPGTIDIEDNTEIAFALFKLLNVVVDRMITQKREIDEIYDLLPEGKKAGIENRDRNATPQN